MFADPSILPFVSIVQCKSVVGVVVVVALGVAYRVRIGFAGLSAAGSITGIVHASTKAADLLKN